MTPKEWRDLIKFLASQASLMEMLPLDEALAAANKADALGPILDPTLYREKQRALDEDRELIRAALPLWSYGRKLAGGRE